MHNISDSMNQFFTLRSSIHNSSPKPNSRPEPTIRSLRENNVDTGIDIHSIDYEFPLQKKVRTKVAEPVTLPGPVEEQLSVSVQTHASQPTYQDSISTETKSPEILSDLESVMMDPAEDESGFSANSLFESIRFGDTFSLQLHIESGFKGSHESMLGMEKYNAFEYAMRCKNFDALMALAPTVNAKNIIDALEKNPEFIHDYRRFSMQLFNASN